MPGGRLRGAAQLLRAEPIRLALGLFGAAVLVFLGVRTLWAAHRIRLGLETADEVTTPIAALRTALMATASNPLTIVYWATAFAAASTAALATSAGTSVGLLVGVGSAQRRGSRCWPWWWRWRGGGWAVGRRVSRTRWPAWDWWDSGRCPGSEPCRTPDHDAGRNA